VEEYLLSSYSMQRKRHTEKCGITVQSSTVSMKQQLKKLNAESESILFYGAGISSRKWDKMNFIKNYESNQNVKDRRPIDPKSAWGFDGNDVKNSLSGIVSTRKKWKALSAILAPMFTESFKKFVDLKSCFQYVLYLVDPNHTALKKQMRNAQGSTIDWGFKGEDVVRCYQQMRADGATISWSALGSRLSTTSFQARDDRGRCVKNVLIEFNPELTKEIDAIKRNGGNKSGQRKSLKRLDDGTTLVPSNNAKTVKENLKRKREEDSDFDWDLVGDKVSVGIKKVRKDENGKIKVAIQNVNGSMWSPRKSFTAHLESMLLAGIKLVVVSGDSTNVIVYIGSWFDGTSCCTLGLVKSFLKILHGQDSILWSSNKEIVKTQKILKF